MGFLDTIMASDAQHAFMDTDAFAESVVYTPKPGTPRTIKAIVERFAPQSVGDASPPRPFMRMTVRDHTTHGIGVRELNTGGDTVTVAYEPGGTAKAYGVHRPSGGEEWAVGGCLTLELY